VPAPKLLRYVTTNPEPTYALVEQSANDLLNAWSIGAAPNSEKWEAVRPPWLSTAIALLGYCAENAPQRGTKIDLDGLGTALSMTPSEMRKFFRDNVTKYDEGAVQLTEAALLRRFADHLRTERKLLYDDFDILRFYLSLKTRPFVMLAGLSGTGKSALGTALGKALGAFEAVAVRPGWDDLRPLFGHQNALTGKFEPRTAAEFFSKANQAADEVHTLLLDELNLSQVEHYLSDVIASFEAEAESPLREIRLAPGEVRRWTTNLRIIGTVNVDESTRGLSPKVLDRANVLEFPAPSHQNIIWGGAGPTTAWNEDHRKSLGEHILGAPTAAVALLGPDGNLRADLNPVLMHIREISRMLGTVGLGIGHRARNEILAFVAHGLDLAAEAQTVGIQLSGPQGGALDIEALMDCQWLQRVLPHLAGPIHVLRKPLSDLKAYFEVHSFPASAQRVDRLTKMQFVHFWSAW
jgi:hypothetical protein